MREQRSKPVASGVVVKGSHRTIAVAKSDNAYFCIVLEATQQIIHWFFEVAVVYGVVGVVVAVDNVESP